jgi:NAD(P)-dependent dehydrogenase (short-subunit alcohol dehydrogenase family)
MRKIVLITGGSQGIGAATAICAARQGYHVCINYHQNDNSANEIVGKIRADGGDAVAMKADISKEDEVVRLFESIDTNVGRLSALVNNAAILESQSRLWT